MGLEGTQKYTMFSHIKIQHHSEIKYLVSKLVTIFLDVLIKCVKMHPRERPKNITLEASPKFLHQVKGFLQKCKGKL